MKIVILTTDNRDHERSYAETRPRFGTAPEALLQGFARLPELEVHVVSCTQKPMPSPEKLAANIWFHSLLAPKIGWLRTGYQGCIRVTRKKLKEIRPDVVHGQGTERDCSISAVFSGFPNVVTIHGNMRVMAQMGRARPLTFYWLAARLEAFTLPRSAGVVCITHYTQAEVKDLARKTWVVPNAVDAGFFDVSPELPREAPPVILCVGNVCPRKNQNAFIRALDPLAAKTKFKVVFLGKAPRGEVYADEFFQLVESRRWCEYAGFADREKLKTFFRRAVILALPSLEDNCPVAVLEAMAAGVPVVAARVGGVPDLLEENRTGLFCDPLDAASMSAPIARLLQQPELGQSLATEAKRHAADHFHPLVIACRHLEIYREVLITRS